MATTENAIEANIINSQEKMMEMALTLRDLILNIETKKLPQNVTENEIIAGERSLKYCCAGLINVPISNIKK